MQISGAKESGNLRPSGAGKEFEEANVTLPKFIVFTFIHGAEAEMLPL
jgi:hypothetical protein